jgi:hypothetical protein
MLVVIIVIVIRGGEGVARGVLAACDARLLYAAPSHLLHQ